MVVKCFLTLIVYYAKMNILYFGVNMKFLIYSIVLEKKHFDKILILLNNQNLAINIIKRNFDVKISILAPNYF